MKDEPIKVQGVSRMMDNDRAFLISLSRVPTDEELRSIHEYLSGWYGVR